VRKLLTTDNTGHTTAYLGILEADPGCEIPRHLHPLSAEIMYVVSGGGVLTVGLEALPFGPDTAIHVPENAPHMASFTGPDKTIMIQLYAPAGPEQRFVDAKAPAAKPAAAPGAKP
jgi:quercetin dioxygenase-like cupin family protein